MLWFGQVLSAIGDRLHQVALVWIAVESAGERAGWVVAAGAVGRLAFGFVGGALADRWDRQRTMIASDWLRAGATATLLFVDLDGPGALWHLGAVSLVLGALDALFQPALQASLPAIAPDLQRLQAANAWLDVTRRFAALVGPSATGLLLAFMGLQQFFGIDALTFALSALLIRALGRGYAWKPAPDQGSGRGMVAEIAAAARLVLDERRLVLGLAQIALWNLVLSPAMSLGLALLVTDAFSAGPAMLGYATGAYGFGNVVSNLLLVRAKVRRTARLMHLGALIAGVGWTAVAWSDSVPLLLLLIALTATGGPMTDLMLLRLIQTEFPPDQIGKIFSFRFTLSRAAGGIGLVLAVPVYAALGVRVGISAGGLLLAGFALAGVLFAAWRGLDERPPAGGY